MNFYDWEEKYETELYDAWCESNYERIADFVDARWKEYKENIDDIKIVDLENEL